MMVTIDEEGRTRVAEAYVVSTPVAGRLQRVEVEPGDPVVRGETVVAQMLPDQPRGAGRAHPRTGAGRGAGGRGRVAGRARRPERRPRQPRSGGDRARRAPSSLSSAASPATRLWTAPGRASAWREAIVDTAEAAIAMREAELANAQAQLIGFDDQGLAAAHRQPRADDIPLYAPADGRILRVMQQSETTLPAGAPIMEIGDIDGDLEVEVELISSDAVQVAVGDPVIIEDWGGAGALAGEVRRIDPFGITKFSALGVEEQRVPVKVALTGPADERKALGHGYRVEARIIVWRAEDALRVPASALFRTGEDWSVFVARDGRALLRLVKIGRNNGQVAEVLDGLDPGDEVVLYPSTAVEDGTSIARRVVN